MKNLINVKDEQGIEYEVDFSFLRKVTKPYKVILSHGHCNLTAMINKESKRVTISSSSGQTSLDFNNRKSDTILNMGRIFVEAAKLAGVDEYPHD